MGLLLLFPGGLGPGSSGVNLAALLDELWAPLNAASALDAMYWTTTDIYQYFDEAAKKLGRDCGTFVRYDGTIATVNGTAAYSLPTDHISTLQVDLAGTVLKPRNVQQLEALDVNWPTAAGTPAAFANYPGLATVTLYPIPGAADAAKTVGVVEHSVPATISAAAAIVAMPTPVREFFRFRALAAARSKESKGQMQDTAQWFTSLAGMMETAIQNFYGVAQ